MNYQNRERQQQSAATAGYVPMTQDIVQELNSLGAFYIENGQHDRAINVLSQAHSMCERLPAMRYEEEQSTCCNAIDTCIIQTRRSRQQQLLSPDALELNHQSSRNQASSSNKTAQHHQSHHLYDDFNTKDFDSSVRDQLEQDGEERFLYRQPIITETKQPQQKVVVGRNTFKLIITLNFAMAHHLSAIESHDLCRKRLQQALHLYELAHQLQTHNGICSPQATMIIANNVGEIHRCVHNHSKHEMCLEHLLSTMMWMVDNHQTTKHNANTSDEWDGFLRNASQLMLRNIAAGAA